nr:chaperone modulator CbpM [uncultured Capnocytophaga sp.]
MEQQHRISKTKVIRLYKIKSSFFNDLVANGLIKTEIIDRVTYVHYDQLPALERFVNWHYDLEINVPSMQIIHRLLEKIQVLQEENQKLRKK